MSRRIALLLLLVLAGCRFEFTRELAPGEIRARVVEKTDQGTEAVADAEVTFDGLRLRGKSDANGRLVLRNVPQGTFTLRFVKHHPDRADSALVLRHVVLDESEGASGRDLGDVALLRVGAIEGRVLANGAPVPHAAVVVGDARIVTSGADGAFRVAGLVPDSYAVSVARATPDGTLTYGTVPAKVAGEQVTKLEVELSSLAPLAAGSVSGRAMYLGRTSHAGIAVQLVEAASGRVVELGTTNETGIFTSGGPVPAGAYVLWARGEGEAVTRLEPVLVNGDVSLPDVFLSAPEGLESGPAHHLVVTGYPDAAKATVPQTLHLAAVDAYENPVPGYAGTVAVTLVQSPPLEPVLVTFTPENKGEQVLEVAFTVAGTFAIEAADTSDSGIRGEQRDIHVRAKPTCGDGETDAFTHEACDDGNSLTEACAYGLESCTVCGADCQEVAGSTTFCGDGHLQFANGEACEDGNKSNDDDCTATCTDARCGDGFVQPGESCDDGNTDETDACTSLCAPPACGDGFLQPNEGCDDGNEDDADLCTTACHPAACGDGFVQRDAGEECDGTADCAADCRHASCNGNVLHAAADATPAILVTSVNDSGAGSLRAALLAATPGAVIGFDPTLAGGKIVLASELVPAASVVVVAPKGGLTLDGNKATRVLRVPAGLSVRLVDVTLANGNVAGQSGGCLDVAGSVVLAGGGLVGCAISDNANSGQGGAAAIIRSGAKLTVAHASVANNVSNYRTGSAGLFTFGTLDVCWTTFTNNASLNGDNVGVGIDLVSGAATVLSSTFAANRSQSGPGGAVHVVGGTFVARDSTFTGNTSNYWGGAVARAGGSVTLERCTIVNNSAPGAFTPIAGEAGGGVMGDVTLSGCLVAGNRGAGGAADDVEGHIVSDGHNVIGAATSNTIGLLAGDRTGTRAAPLAALASGLSDFGGPTKTVALLPGSPAFGQGNPALAGVPDQRGVPRSSASAAGAIDVSLPGVQAPGLLKATSRRFDLSAVVTPAGGLPTTAVLEWSTAANFGAITKSAPVKAGRGPAPATVSFRVLGLSPQTSYWARVKVTNRDGSVTSGVLQVTTPADP